MSRVATPAGQKMKANNSVTYPAVSSKGSDGGVLLTDNIRQLSLSNGNASISAGSPAVTQEGSSKGFTRTSTHSQAVGMHSAATPFMPGGQSSYSSGPLAQVSKSKPSPVSMLARDSQPDGPTIVESTPKRDSYVDGFNQKAVGDESPRETTPEQVEPVVRFTSDTVAVYGSHFVKVVKVEQATFAKLMDTLDSDYHWQTKLLGQRSDHADPSKKYVTLYFCFDDLSDANAAFDDMSVVANDRWAPSHVLHDEYAAAPDGDQAEIGRYDGQVCFEATFDDVLSNVNMPNIKDVVYKLACDFGHVIAMSDVSSHGANSVKFRVEYSKITAAREALRAVTNSPVNHEEWTIRAKPWGSLTKYANGDFVPYTPHKQVGTASNAGTYTSPSGRTTWKVMPDGNKVICAPANTVAKVLNAPSDQITLVSRDRWMSEPMPFTPYHYDPTYQPRAQSWSANTATGPRYANTETEPQCVRVDRINNGMDVRTTVMLRNLPNKWGVTEWKQMLDKYTFGMYDFSYLRIDFGNSYNVGYGFVNFTESRYIGNFLDAWMGQEWEPGHHPEKRVQLSYATVQGYDCLVEKFRNSSIMEEFEGYRPKLWYTPDTAPAPEYIGTEKKFDPPNNRTKQQRSRDNAGHIGLYAPRSGQRGQDRARRSNFDRGTPRQLQEDAAWHAHQGLFNPAFGFQQGGQYITGGPGPVGAPPAMYPPAMYAQNAAFAPYGMSYPYAPQQYGGPTFMPAPGAYGPGYGNGGFAGYGPRNPANMSRTISRGRLAGGRPQNVTLSRDYEVPRAFNGGDQYAGPAQSANGGNGYQYAGQY
ncbi:Meiosis protein mei2 [Fulvia fulva]|uniref:Meiosis protein mei2 n=1 Tax=Passalora fulva TaxID=5499 RepID=A0A9Q8PAV9_PASFU|nr:Meiosis protein mei2 [Fulvia fulva]UJO19113.1 Meiosis protein mei2 [Fulvia fulva]WPV30643.1 Meiosis protein mei2 [Fulvia fulva]